MSVEEWGKRYQSIRGSKITSYMYTLFFFFCFYGTVFLDNLSLQRLRTLSPPPSSAAHEPGEATTCALSVAYSLGATRRRSGVCSAST